MAELPETPTPTLTAIYADYEARQGNGFRDHLGASIIGKSCARALWYDFRWVTPARHSGRLLRLFETGQLEEDRLVRNLRATGATVLEVDPETGRQFRVEAHGGHFGGSLDGVAIGILEAPKTWHVLEFKTHGVKSFNELTAKGVVLAKPQHAAQMQIYMHLTGITRATAPEVTYVHFLCDQNEVVLADGTWSESFQPGDYSLAGLGDEQRQEIFEIFPELKTDIGLEAFGAARRSLKRHEAVLVVNG